MEPRPLLDGGRLIAPDPTNPPLTSPTKSFRDTVSYGPRHISTARITQHPTPKQAVVLQELNRYWFFTEEVHQKTSVWSTIIPQHPTSVWKPRHIVTLEAFFVFRNHLRNMFHHFSTCKTRKRRTPLNHAAWLLQEAQQDAWGIVGV
jgi:hypothetical protein